MPPPAAIAPVVFAPPSKRIADSIWAILPLNPSSSGFSSAVMRPPLFHLCTVAHFQIHETIERLLEALRGYLATRTSIGIFSCLGIKA